MKKRNVWITIGAVVFVGFLLVLFFGLYPGNGKENGNQWQTIKVTQRNIETSVLATGIIKPKTGAEVQAGSRVSGIVKHLHVNIGDRVRRGDLLAEIDPMELQARYDQAEAALDNAKAELKYSELDLERKQSLRKKDFTSQSNVDLAERANEVAASQVKQADANLEYARIQLAYTKIHAPIAGVVASVTTQEGETVTASFVSPTFVTIIDLDRLEVWAYVDETDIGRIHVGQRATFTVDTYTDIDFEGEVTAIYPKAEMKDNVVNYITIVEITNSREKILRPEMTATLRVSIENRKNVLAIPNRAVRRDGKLRYVFVMENGSPTRRMIKTGAKDKQFTEISDGLQGAETIILGTVDPSSNQ